MDPHSPPGAPEIELPMGGGTALVLLGLGLPAALLGLGALGLLGVVVGVEAFEHLGPLTGLHGFTGGLGFILGLILTLGLFQLIPPNPAVWLALAGQVVTLGYAIAELNGAPPLTPVSVLGVASALTVWLGTLTGLLIVVVVIAVMGLFSLLGSLGKPSSSDPDLAWAARAGGLSLAALSLVGVGAATHFQLDLDALTEPGLPLVQRAAELILSPDDLPPTRSSNRPAPPKPPKKLVQFPSGRGDWAREVVSDLEHYHACRAEARCQRAARVEYRRFSEAAAWRLLGDEAEVAYIRYPTASEAQEVVDFAVDTLKCQLPKHTLDWLPAALRIKDLERVHGASLLVLPLVQAALLPKSTIPLRLKRACARHPRLFLDLDLLRTEGNRGAHYNPEPVAAPDHPGLLAAVQRVLLAMD